MSSFIEKLSAFMRDEEGLTTVEYAIAGGLVGAVVIVAFKELGLTVGSVIEYIDTQISDNSPAAA
jgi:pilus assembly protein Flp/PilA